MASFNLIANLKSLLLSERCSEVSPNSVSIFGEYAPTVKRYSTKSGNTDLVSTVSVYKATLVSSFGVVSGVDSA